MIDRVKVKMLYRDMRKVKRYLKRLLCGGVMAWACMICPAEDEKKDAGGDWSQGSPLEVLWEEGKLKDITPKELADELLKDTAYWKLGNTQLWVRGCDKLDFASESMPDVLFVWDEYEIDRVVKGREGEVGTSVRLSEISCLLYRKMIDEDEDAGMNVANVERIVNRLNAYLKKKPKTTRTKLNDARNTNYTWQVKDSQVVLESSVKGAGKNEGLDYVKLTIIPDTKLAKATKLSDNDKTANDKSAKDKTANTGKSSKFSRKALEVRVDSYVLCNAAKLPQAVLDKDSEPDVAMAFIASFYGKNLHDMAIAFTRRSKLSACVRGWNELKELLPSVKETNKKKKPAVAVDSGCYVVGNVPFYLLGHGYDVQMWLRKYNDEARLMMHSRKKKKIKALKEDFEDKDLDVDVIESMKYIKGTAENMTLPKQTTFIAQFGDGGAKMRLSVPSILADANENISSRPILWFVTEGLKTKSVGASGKSTSGNSAVGNGPLKGRIRVILQCREHEITYAEFRPDGVVKDKVSPVNAQLISEYYAK